ncbi:uncharacterized protein METZ01_LOCUS175985, partial [marine metagenome]
MLAATGTLGSLAHNHDIFETILSEFEGAQMRIARTLFSIVALACVGCQPTPEEALIARHEATIVQTCLNCHNRTNREGGLVLAGIDLDSVSEHVELMEKVVRKLRAGMMPPPGKKRPPLTDYVALTDWLEEEIDRTAPV